MIALPPGARVWLACGVTDMRRGMPGLALMCRRRSVGTPMPGTCSFSAASRDRS